MGLTELLEVRPGITAVIGGGGKTTLLRTLGEELAGKGRRVLLCTTTKIYPFPGLPLARSLEELERLRRDHTLLCAGTEVPGTGKLSALGAPVAALEERFDYLLVEADGSAGRPLKAHEDFEPVIPDGADQTICVVGASGFGQPVEEAAHRPERYAALAGRAVTDEASPETEAVVLMAEGLHQKIYVNQVETLIDLAAARTLAGLLDCPVLAGSLRRGAYFPAR